MTHFPVFVNGLERLEQKIRDNTVFIAHDFFGGDAIKMSDYRQWYIDGLKTKGITPIFPDMEGKPGHLLKTICIHIINSPIGIFDISTFNANVLIEYGMALGMNRPSILVAEESLQIPDYLLPLRIHRFTSKVKLAKEIPTILEQYLHSSHEDFSGNYCHICGTRCGAWHKELHSPKDYLITGFSDDEDDELHYNTSIALSDFNLNRIDLPPRGKLDVCRWVSTIRRSRLALFHLPKNHHGAENAAINIQIGIAAGLGTPWTLILRDDAKPPTDLEGIFRGHLGNSNTVFRNQLSNVIRGLLNSRLNYRGVFTELDREELMLEENFDLTDIEDTQRIIVVLIILKSSNNELLGNFIQFTDADLPYKLRQNLAETSSDDYPTVAEIRLDGEELYLQARGQSIQLDEISINPEDKALRLYDKAQIAINESNWVEFRLGKSTNQLKIEDFPLPPDNGEANKLILQGVHAYHQDNMLEAKNLFMRAIEVDGHSELAWLWLSASSEKRDEVIYCLQMILDINPANSLATALLKRMGVDAATQANSNLEVSNFYDSDHPAHNPSVHKVLTQLAQEFAPSLLQSMSLGKDGVSYLAESLVEFGILVLVSSTPIADSPLDDWTLSYTKLYRVLASVLFPSLADINLKWTENGQPNVAYLQASAIPVLQIIADYIVPYVELKQHQIVTEDELQDLLFIALKSLAGKTTVDEFNQLNDKALPIIHDILAIPIKHYSLTKLKGKLPQSPEQKSGVFISDVGAQQAAKLGAILAERLTELMIPFNYATLNSREGTYLPENVEQRLKSSEFLIYFLTPQSKTDELGIREIRLAQENYITVLPVLVEGSIEESLPETLRFVQVLDLRENVEAGIQQIIAVIQDKTPALSTKPAQESKPYVLIAYSREDYDVALSVKHFIEREEIIVWMDVEAIAPGTPNWNISVEKGLNNMEALILIMTPESKKSNWINEEVNYARTLNKPIYALLARGNEHESIPFGIISSQYTDIRTNFEAGMRQLLEVLPPSVKQIIEPKTATRSSKIFINYSHDDGIDALRVADVLTQAGYPIWIDRQLEAGSIWQKEIDKAIRDCDIFLYVISKKSALSPNCLYEYRYAVELHKPILPVIVHSKVSLPDGFVESQYVAFFASDSINVLLEAVDSFELKPNVDPIKVSLLIPELYAERRDSERKAREAEEKEIMTSGYMINDFKKVFDYLHQLPENEEVQIFDINGGVIGRRRRAEAIASATEQAREHVNSRIREYLENARRELDSQNPIAARNALKQKDRFKELETYIEPLYTSDILQQIQYVSNAINHEIQERWDAVASRFNQTILNIGDMLEPGQSTELHYEIAEADALLAELQELNPTHPDLGSYMYNSVLSKGRDMVE